MQGLTRSPHPDKTPLKAASSLPSPSRPALSPAPTEEASCSVTRTEEMEIGKLSRAMAAQAQVLLSPTIA